MLDDNPNLEISELCERVDIPLRTVRYYIQQGLLPPTQREGAGRGPRYGEIHVATLRAIRELQKQGMTLDAIRERLAALDMRGLARLAKADEQSTLPNAPHSSPSLSMAIPRMAARMSTPPSSRDESPPETPRSHWERITITPDIELHVRRPLAPYWNKQLETLLALARRLLGGKTP